MREPLPWEVVETFPSADPDLIAHWFGACGRAGSPAERVEANVGAALSSYWAVQSGHEQDFEANLKRRRELVAAAWDAASETGEPDLLATAALGRLHALWGPDDAEGRREMLVVLGGLAPRLVDEDLRARAIEWRVLQCFDLGDLDGVRTGAAELEALGGTAADTLRCRRIELWRANLAMLEGDLDRAVAINTGAISATASTAGSPFSFQNAAITIAIERFLRRGLADVLDSVRSIRASSPRVAANWDVGLAFTLSECGELDEAARLFAEMSRADFAGVPRDLNWLVTMHLLGLVAVHLEDTAAMEVLLGMLGPHEHLDATHGCGYASYGPVGRVVGSLAAHLGDPDRADKAFASVLASREPGPWTALTLHDRAVARSGADPDAAERLAEAAATECDRLGLSEWAEAARSVRARALEASAHRASVTVGPDGCVLRHPLGTARVSGKGAQYLVRMLLEPGEPIAAAELDDPGGHGARVPKGSRLAVADDEALTAYRRRLSELRDRASELDTEELAEVEFLRRTVAAARHMASSAPEDERVRVRVTKAIRRCLDSVAEQSPRLGLHLREAVSTGTSCMYAPADGLRWEHITPGGNLPGAP